MFKGAANSEDSSQKEEIFKKIFVYPTPKGTLSNFADWLSETDMYYRVHFAVIKDGTFDVKKSDFSKLSE